MKRKGKPTASRIISLHVYGIIDKNLAKVTKVSLNREELEFELDCDNHDNNLMLCDFELKVKFDF